MALSLNEYTVKDAFAFAGEIRTHTMNEDDMIGKQSNTVFLKDQYWDLSYSTYSLMISLILSMMLN